MYLKTHRPVQLIDGWWETREVFMVTKHSTNSPKFSTFWGWKNSNPCRGLPSTPQPKMMVLFLIRFPIAYIEGMWTSEHKFSPFGLIAKDKSGLERDLLGWREIESQEEMTSRNTRGRRTFLLRRELNQAEDIKEFWCYGRFSEIQIICKCQRASRPLKSSMTLEGAPTCSRNPRSLNLHFNIIEIW